MHIVNTDITGRLAGVRKNGSTDARNTSVVNDSHFWAAIGVDTSRIFEAYIAAAAVEIWLIGYLDSDAVFFTNAANKSLGSTGSWLDIDISSDTGADTAIAAILEIILLNTTDTWGVRKNGSSDSRLMTGISHRWAIIGVDGSEIFEHQINVTDVDCFLVGYLKAGATLNTNAPDRSLGSTGSWLDLTALPSGAVGGIYEISGAVNANYGLRKNGSAESILRRHRDHAWGLVECDGSQIVEGQISSTTIDFFEIGYFMWAEPLWHSGSPWSKTALWGSSYWG